MRRLSSRLAAVESRLRPKPPPVMRGTYEIHYTDAAPDCFERPGNKFQRCKEHGPRCAAFITPVHGQVRRLITVAGIQPEETGGLD